MKYSKTILSIASLSLAISFGFLSSNSAKVIEGDHILGMTCQKCAQNTTCNDVTGNTGCHKINGVCKGYRDCGQTTEDKCIDNPTGTCNSTTEPAGCGTCVIYVCEEDFGSCDEISTSNAPQPGGVCN